jgi:DNA modification methylase
MIAPETIAEGITLHPGDCLDVLKAMADASVDSCVTDPPYHLTSIVKRFGAPDAAPAKEGKTGAYARASRGFMGKQWDGGDIAFRTELWAEVLRVLKPGGHLLAFSGTRTYHRMTCAIEDAGFEIRDQIGWAYGSGFPKSHDVSKGIDKAAGAERQIIGPNKFAHLNGKATVNVYGAAARANESAPVTDFA